MRKEELSPRFRYLDAVSEWCAITTKDRDGREEASVVLEMHSRQQLVQVRLTGRVQCWESWVHQLLLKLYK